jgi:hypothetical protein
MTRSAAASRLRKSEFLLYRPQFCSRRRNALVAEMAAPLMAEAAVAEALMVEALMPEILMAEAAMEVRSEKNGPVPMKYG